MRRVVYDLLVARNPNQNLVNPDGSHHRNSFLIAFNPIYLRSVV